MGPPGFSFIIYPSVFKTLRFQDISVSGKFKNSI
jgi:hypothetical protein